MPTKKKRVGFIPREDVMKIIDKLSIENNLSNSKIISILVEEALSLRGIFNKKTGKASQIFHEPQDSPKYISEDSAANKNNEEFKINKKSGYQMKSKELNLIKQTNQDSFDFLTYKKFLSFLKFQEMMDEFHT